jgi:hypothetical protein
MIDGRLDIRCNPLPLPDADITHWGGYIRDDFRCGIAIYPKAKLDTLDEPPKE